MNKSVGTVMTRVVNELFNGFSYSTLPYLVHVK